MSDRTCPTCAQPVSAGARFCQSCGVRLDAEPGEPGSISYSQPELRLFGVLTPTPTLVLACVVLIGSIVALATGSVVPGVMLLAFAAALFVLFYGAAERDRESSRVGRAAVDGVERVFGWVRFGRESATAWSGAGRRVVQIKREQRRLRSGRGEGQLALGEAAYAQDEPGIASLRARMAQIDDAIAEGEREREAALARARTRVDDERLTVQPTEHLPPDQADGGEGQARPTS